MTIHGQVCIFNGAGTWGPSVEGYKTVCENFVDSRAVRLVDGPGCFHKDVSLFVLPGGHAIRIHENNKLLGREVDNFVKEGGRFLGGCAGSILPTQKSIYRPCLLPKFFPQVPEDWIDRGLLYTKVYNNNNDEISEFQGHWSKYEGTLVAPYSFKNLRELASPENLVPLEVSSLSGASFHLPYYSGPAFLGARDEDILLRYQDPIALHHLDSGIATSKPRIEDKNPAAVVSYQYGTGSGVLCSPHVELTPQAMKDLKPDMPQSDLQLLQESELARMELLTSMFARLQGTKAC